VLRTYGLPGLYRGYGLFLYPKNIFIDSVSQFLVVIHADQTADLYVNDFPVTIEVTPKKDMNLGEILMLSDIADTRKVSFPSVAISENAKCDEFKQKAQIHRT